MAPAIAIAILVVGGCLALVLDQLWLQNAHQELQSASNSAALAAAREMANDDLLRADLDHHDLADTVRKVAANIGMHHNGAGNQIYISNEANVDIRLGHVVDSPATGQREFLETDFSPSAVVVKSHCDEANGNPVRLFLPLLTGQSTADVVATAEASINNQIVGVRPFDNANVPAWPIGILERSLDPRQQKTWENAIENGVGPDNFKWDRATGTVMSGSDGLPEITLRPTIDEDNPGNFVLLDVGTSLMDGPLQTQFVDGWGWRELQQNFNSEFNLSQGPISMHGSVNFDGMPTIELKKQIGQKRIVVLYTGTTNEEKNSVQPVTATRLVAGRIMQVSSDSDGIQLIMQPAVIATRTALTQKVNAGGVILRNKYLYKLSLTR